MTQAQSPSPFFPDAENKANAELLSAKGWLVGAWAGLVPAPAEGFGPLQYEALTMCANFESFGARVSEETSRQLSWQDARALSNVYFLGETAIRQATGAHRDFQPMFPGFPKQVVDAAAGDLLRAARAHYASVAAGERDLPAFAAVAREPEALTNSRLSFEIVDEARAEQHLSALARSNAAMSPAHRDALGRVAKALCNRGRASQAAQALSGGSNKENLAAAAAVAREIGAFAPFCAQLSACTDALRVACAISGGDASLAEKTKFKSFARSERRALMGVVERHLAEGDSEQALENMFSRREPWLRLGERLHPGELKGAFPLAAMAFEDLRSKNAPRPFADKVAEAFGSADAASAIKLLRSRPGEFARRAAAASRALGPSAHGPLAKAFEGCAERVSTPALLQALGKFESAAAGPASSRAFMPKGGMGKVFLRIEEGEGTPSPKAMAPEFASAMASACERALLSRFAQFEPLGKVYVDPALDKVNAPFAARSASRQTKTLARGSRLPVEGQVVRLFAWWSERGLAKDGSATRSDRIDIDLSCQFLDEDFRPAGHVSWTMLRGSGAAVVHSGDITSAPNGACEFIDVDFAKLDPAIKYIGMSINSYTGQSFDEMPECFAGWMERAAGMSGKLFDARAVKGKSDVAMASTSCMPIFLDVDAREIVWADVTLPGNSGYAMAERQTKTVSMTLQALAEMRKPTMGRLARLHAAARGTFAATAQEADVVFGLHEGVTPYDFELIASELLADAPPASPTIKKPAPAPAQSAPSARP